MGGRDCHLARTPQACGSHGSRDACDAASSGSGSLVVMVQPAEIINLDHATATSRMDVSMFGAIHLQRLMSSPPVIVVEVAGEDATQMPLVQDNHVIKAFATDASDQSFNVRTLPRGPSGNDDLLDAHVPHSAAEVLAVDPVAIAQQVARCLVPRKRLDDPLSDPRGGGAGVTLKCRTRRRWWARIRDTKKI